MFPFEVIRFIQLGIKFARKLKWALIVSIYYGAFMSFLMTGRPWGVISLIPPLSIAYWAYSKDKKREEEGIDDFRGDQMFFRYGEMINYAVLSIPVKQEWSFTATEVSASTLRATLAQHVAARLPNSSVQVFENKTISDLGTGQKKDFTRIRVYTPLGSSITFFIYYASFGHTITAHYFTYRRGALRPIEVVKFILASPLTLWIWALPWLLNRYSIISKICRSQIDSFDAIDLDTIHRVTTTVVLEETEKILQAAKLLSKTIANAINFHINNVNNGPSIAISGSSNVNIGNGNMVQSAAPSPPPTAQPAAPATAA